MTNISQRSVSGRYRKKPIEIDAWQVGSDYKPHWIDVAIANDDLTYHGRNRYTMRHDNVVDGYLEASAGQWIIRGIKGELYVCDDDIFIKTYEAIAFSDISNAEEEQS